MDIFFDLNTFDELIESLKQKYKRLEIINENLREENEQHRNKTYEIGYVSKLREENKRLKEDYYRGFPISKEEKESIDKWTTEHYKTCNRISGCSYHFYPTELGVAGVVQCSCGAKFEFQEIG